MINREEIFQKYMIGYSNHINKVTRPLKDHFDIPFFGYHRIDMKGNYTVLCNQLDWAEHYLENQLYIDDPYLNHPDAYASGISFFGQVEKRRK